MEIYILKAGLHNYHFDRSEYTYVVRVQTCTTTHTEIKFSMEVVTYFLSFKWVYRVTQQQSDGTSRFLSRASNVRSASLHPETLNTNEPHPPASHLTNSTMAIKIISNVCCCKTWYLSCEICFKRTRAAKNRALNLRQVYREDKTQRRLRTSVTTHHWPCQTNRGERGSMQRQPCSHAIVLTLMWWPVCEVSSLNEGIMWL